MGKKGLSSVLSTSLQSIASINQQAPLSHQLTSSWSSNSRRHQTSLFSTVVTNHLTQFTRFMYAQTIMFKNDSGGLLGQGGIQFNPNLVNLGMIGLDSIEYINSTSTTNTTTTPSNSSTSLVSAANVAATAKTTTNISSSSTTTTTNKALVKSSPFGSGFSLFNLLARKGGGGGGGGISGVSGKMEATNEQHQQNLHEQQQQKLKQQKTDLKTIGQYIKSFESIVIRSLRQYTLTTSVNLQTRILELLAQLIFLKVLFNILCHNTAVVKSHKIT